MRICTSLITRNIRRKCTPKLEYLSIKFSLELESLKDKYTLSLKEAALNSKASFLG